MKQQLMATVLDGVLRPDEKPAFAEWTRVKLTIEVVEPARDPASAWESLKARLRERPVHGGGKRFTRDELHSRENPAGVPR